ncbi:MAG TPA: SIMPL domain-containing protein [Acidimicrobiia bacterium]|nr:SIMPL domain-containing protein [Acidimicrobiia bacterium]
MSNHDSGITVVGTGSADTAPDVMSVDIGVSVRSDTVESASSQTRAHATSLIEALTARGLDHKDIATRNFSVHPEYDHRDGQERLLGYRVTNDLTVTIRDVAGAGSILDAAISAVGDPVTINRVQLSVDDETAARDRAREAAWGDALARAEHLARLAGATLGPAVSIVESAGQMMPPRPMMRAALAEATPIEAGTASITVTLEVRFGLD